jgi:hypothetical protein
MFANCANVIERAVILARGGSLEFDLPLQTGVSASPVLRSRSETAVVEADEPQFLTEAELQLREARQSAAHPQQGELEDQRSRMARLNFSA